MKKITSLLMLHSVLFLLINLHCFAQGHTTQVSIVAEKSQGVPVSQAINKLIDAFKAKNITVEKIGSLDEARGNLIIVTGLSSGGGVAANLLKTANHLVPKVAEALTIWKTDWKKKPVWLISGFDDRGLMYGLLDVADRVSWSTDSKAPMSEVEEITEKPDVRERAISIYTMNRAYWESRFYDLKYSFL